MKTKQRPPVELTARVQAKAAQFIDWLVMNGIERTVAADKVRVFAEDIAGKRPSSRSKVERGTVLPVLERYRALSKEKFGEWPVMTGADMALITKLVAVYGPEIVQRRLFLLAKTTDRWLQQQPFTLRTLHHQWARVAQLDKSSRPQFACQHQPPCQTAQEHNQRFLSDVAKSSSDETALTAPATSRQNGRC